MVWYFCNAFFAPLGVFILLTLEDEWYAIINYVRLPFLRL